MPRLSNSTGTGDLPKKYRLSREGSSCRAVVVPTRMASASIRHLWVSRREAAPLIQKGCRLEGAMRPFWVSAHFRMIYGLFFRRKMAAGRESSRPSSSSTPVVTCTPPRRNCSTPLPLMRGEKSRQDTTTLGMRCSRMRLEQGGVFPYTQQGSRETYSVLWGISA